MILKFGEFPYLHTNIYYLLFRANANVVARHFLPSWAFLVAKKWLESVALGASFLTTTRMLALAHAKKTPPVI